MEPKDIAKAIRASRFQYSNEFRLQRGLAELFTYLGLEFQPEFRLNIKDRIDFLIAGGIGIEVKVEGALAAVTRQLFRYADCAEIKCLILVTSRHIHRGLPPEINGKPLEVVYLLNSFL